MKTLQLLRLALSNFKGTASFELVPGGECTTVCGTNGAGKTTLFDAYCWLLFGKDSAGHSDSAFDLKPYGSEGATVEVTGLFLLHEAGESRELTLTRRLAEKAVRQRGTDEMSIKNEYTFLVNDVPKPKTQYDSFIAELCPAKHFRLLSDPDSFAGKLKWEERRAILTELFGQLDEAALLTSDLRWQPLRDAAGRLSVSDYRAAALAERRKIKQELDSIPAQLEEAQRAIPAGAGAQPPDSEECARIEQEIRQLEGERSEIISGGAAAQAKQQLAEAKAEAAQAKAEYFSRQTDTDSSRRLDALRQELGEAERALQVTALDISGRTVRKERLERERDALREEWRTVNAQEWSRGAEVCFQCGQPLPSDRVEQMRAEFNLRKSNRLAANASSGKQKSEELSVVAGELSELQRRAVELNEKTTALAAEIEKLKAAQSVPAFESTGEYKTLQERLARCEAAVTRAEQESAAAAAQLDVRLEERRAQQQELQRRVLLAETVTRQERRIAELKDRGRELGKRAAALDRLLDLAAAFEQHKLTAIEEDINSRFSYARFKLFDRQLNGGYSECCEVVVDGAPYSTNLNPGKKINAGLDIIRTLSGGFGLICPVWIDNAESYVEIMDIGRQRIELRVDAAAPALTVD